MLYRTFIIIVLCLSAVTQSMAGWYECYNFEGKVGDYPITLYIQRVDGYYGDADKKHFNLAGVYKYNHINTPIVLEGVLDTVSGKVALYEQDEDGSISAFTFSLVEGGMVEGGWISTDDNAHKQLTLQFVSMLRDKVDSDDYEDIPILQQAALTNFYFVGKYSKKAGKNSAVMTSLDIIRKSDNKVFQTLDFSNIETATGNVSTIIFQNIDVPIKQQNSFLIWNGIGRIGGYLNVHFDRKRNRFVMNTTPVIDGPQ